jgi:osmotically-inducible protein OsmY
MRPSKRFRPLSRTIPTSICTVRHPVQVDHDGEIADAVRLAPEKDPSVPRGQIDVTVDHERVRLAGAVDSEEQSRLAALDCWYVPRVTGVDDGLAVKTP